MAGEGDAGECAVWKRAGYAPPRIDVVHWERVRDEISLYVQADPDVELSVRGRDDVEPSSHERTREITFSAQPGDPDYVIIEARDSRDLYGMRLVDMGGGTSPNRPFISTNRPPTSAKPGDEVRVEVSVGAASAGGSLPEPELVAWYKGGVGIAPELRSEPVELAELRPLASASARRRSYELVVDGRAASEGDLYYFLLRAGTAHVLATVGFLPLAPELDEVGRQVVLAGDTFSMRLSATHGDGEPVVYGLDGAPPGLALDADTGEMTFTPTAEEVGTHCVTAWAASNGARDEEVFVLEVRMTAGSAPVLRLLEEVEPLVLGESRSFPLEVIDPDGDEVTVELTSGKGLLHARRGGYELRYTTPRRFRSRDRNPLAAYSDLVIIEATDGAHTSRLEVPITATQKRDFTGKWNIETSPSVSGYTNMACLATCQMFELSPPDDSGHGMIRRLEDNGSRLSSYDERYEVGYRLTPHEAMDGSAWLTFEQDPTYILTSYGRNSAFAGCRRMRIIRVENAILILDADGKVAAAMRYYDGTRHPQYDVLNASFDYSRWLERDYDYRAPSGSEYCHEWFATP